MIKIVGSGSVILVIGFVGFIGFIEFVEFIGFIGFIEFVEFVEFIGFVGFIEFVEFIGFVGFVGFSIAYSHYTSLKVYTHLARVALALFPLVHKLSTPGTDPGPIQYSRQNIAQFFNAARFSHITSY